MRKLFKQVFVLCLVIIICLTAHGQKITQAEYFYDQDPGVGLGIPLSVSQADSLDRGFTLQGSPIAEGFHILGLRVKARGRWGLAQCRTFFIARVSVAAPSFQLTSGEYYIDSDPGAGNGRPMIGVQRGDSVDLSLSIPTASLADGHHILVTRCKDVLGRWSASSARTFWVLRVPTSFPRLRLAKAEWYIDNDPGAGRATALNAFPAGDSSVFVASIPSQGLLPGFHTLGVRVADSAGRWGMVQARTFFIGNPSLANRRRGLARAEYFFDGQDPGIGRAIPFLNFSPGAEIDLTRRLPVRGLPLGEHRISLRIADSLGRWAPLQTRTFTITRPQLLAMAPSAVGNIGAATLRITGEAFTDSTRLRLVPVSGGRQPISLDTGLVQVGGRNLLITYDFSGLDTGTFNLEATFPGRPDTVITLARALRIEGGIPPLVTAELITYPAIRINTWTPFQVLVQNQGNIDARGVPVMVQLPEGAEVRWPFKYKPFINDQVLQDSLEGETAFVILDSALGSTTTTNAATIWMVPVVGARETFVLTFHAKMPSSAATNNRMAAYTLAPFIGKSTNNPDGRVSPSAPNSLGCLSQFADSECKKKEVETSIQLLESALGLAAGPIASCVYDVASTVLCSVINIDTDNPDGDRTPGDFLTTYGMALWGCTPVGLFSVGKARRIAKILKKLTEGLSNFEQFGTISGLNRACPAPPPAPPKPKTPRIAGSFDPNDKLGATGNNRLGYTQTNTKFPYLIRFENLRTATAPAVTVTINDTLDTRVFDPSTIELGYVGFGDTISVPPAGLNRWRTEISLAPVKPYVIRITAGYNAATHVLSWFFETLDQATLQPVFGADDGFLPPNVTSPEGEGAVFFTIGVRPNLPVGTVVKNRASIIFDNNSQILTPAWVNRVDNVVPQSQVIGLSTASPTRFRVSWAGNDQGSGIQRYNIFVRVNNGDFQLWKSTDSTFGTFTGQLDSTYAFYSVSIDSAGNLERPPLMPDASTTVSGIDKAEVAAGFRLQLVPNQNNGRFLLLYSEVNSDMRFFIADAQGQVLSHDKLPIGSKQKDIALSLRPGIYYLKVQHPRGVINRRFIIQ